VADFFIRNFIAVYFFYGLSFFIMGLAILLEVSHSSELDFAQALRPLAGFGLVHGSHEWFEMFLLIQARSMNITEIQSPWIAPLRIGLLAISFLLLVAFGARLISGPTRTRVLAGLLIIVASLWLVGLIWVLQTQIDNMARIVAADVYTRYSLAIPGAALTVWGLILLRRQFIQAGMQCFGNDLILAAIAFGVYGGIGQLFAAPSFIFPSKLINTDVFLKWFGFPVQVLRAMMAFLAAIAIIRSLHACKEDTHRRMEALRQDQLVERQRLEELRAELLHRTVRAQESERQRIARELHDETGQTLTALGMGLRALSQNISSSSEQVVTQIRKLESIAAAGIVELQRIVSGLHPPQLDDLGLSAALRWYASDIATRFGTQIQVTTEGTRPILSSDQRVVLFRIAQEAITNIIRHTEADQIIVHLDYDAGQSVNLSIEDNGSGFDVNSVMQSGFRQKECWGLLGMMERANLIGGICTIDSTPGKGTKVTVKINMVGEKVDD
jgi:signal transduction histidine kinase